MVLTAELSSPWQEGAEAELSSGRWGALWLTCRVCLSSPFTGNSHHISDRVFMPIISSKVVVVVAQSIQSCPALCDPMDCSPPGSSVHGILQARVLKWGALLSSRGLNPSLLCLLHWQAGSLTLVPSGKPLESIKSIYREGSVVVQKFLSSET